MPLFADSPVINYALLISCPTKEPSCYAKKIYTNFISEEIVFVFAYVSISIGYYLLINYIRINSDILIRKLYMVKQLKFQNHSLRQQIRKSQTRTPTHKLDMDSPLTKVIKAIISISETPELNEDEIEGLDYAVFLLSSAKVYIPVFGSSGETDVTKWLNGMLTNGKSEISGTVEQTVRAQIMPLALKSTNSFVSDCLKDISNWSFDIFELAKVSNGRPLLFLGMALFEAYGIQSALHVDPSHMESFLTAVEGSYRAKNTYHNSTHAADVLHSMHYYMDVIGLRKYLSALDIFSCIISAAIHDVDHPGFNNAYMVATDSDLALRYNDQTVLENHHCFKGFDIIFNRPNCNLLQSFPNDLRHKVLFGLTFQLRQTVISMVLATDMSNHFEYIGKFKNKFNGAGTVFVTYRARFR